MLQGLEAMPAMMPRIPIDLGSSSHAWIVIGGRRLAGAESVAVLQTCGTEIRSEADTFSVYDLYGAE